MAREKRQGQCPLITVGPPLSLQYSKFLSPSTVQGSLLSKQLWVLVTYWAIKEKKEPIPEHYIKGIVLFSGPVQSENMYLLFKTHWEIQGGKRKAWTEARDPSLCELCVTAQVSRPQSHPWSGAPALNDREVSSTWFLTLTFSEYLVVLISVPVVKYYHNKSVSRTDKVLFSQ